MGNHRAAPETEPNVNDLVDIGSVVQPIINKDIILIHNGSVSNKIYNDLFERYGKDKTSDLDSEAIIWAYLDNNRNMQQTMKYLSGGFAFLMVDMTKNKLYAVCTHNPLYCGYVRGYGMFWSSIEEAIWSTISLLKGTKIDRHNMSVFEDYYCRMVPHDTIEEIDLDTGLINEFKFEPRYITPNWDPYVNSVTKKSNTVLVAASGGLDSTTSLAVLKYSGFAPIAVHFKYGHRGQDCELTAISTICNMLNIPLKVFDIETIVKDLDKDGMLTTKDSKIITGTEDGLKTTAAWTTWRNGLFLSYMGAYAESLIVKHNYDTIYITGGFMQLSESASFGDNSERFLQSFLKFNRFASICGNRVKPLYGCCDLLKSEQYILLDNMKLLKKLSPFMISCDRPKLINGYPHNCQKNGKPACGSGALSYWASKIAGVDDNRKYYEVDDNDYTLYTPRSTLEEKNFNIYDIVDRISIPSGNKKMLKDYLERVELWV